MRITDYYRLRILPENEGKRTVRYDTVASSGSYQLFEDMAAQSKVKRFFCYYNGVPDTSTDYKQVELFIIRGEKFNQRALYNLMVTGQLNQEIQEVRNQAISIGG